MNRHFLYPLRGQIISQVPEFFLIIFISKTWYFKYFLDLMTNFGSIKFSELFCEKLIYKYGGVKLVLLLQLDDAE